MELVREVFVTVISNVAVQNAIAVVIVALIGYVARKKAIAKKIALFAADAYEFAESKGYLDGLKGYQKFDPFMDRLTALIWEHFGRDATPKEKGEAVKVMEGLVEKEHVGK